MNIFAYFFSEGMGDTYMYEMTIGCNDGFHRRDMTVCSH